MKKYIFLCTFVIMLTLIILCDTFSPVRSFSELENRYLKNKPRFSLKSYLQGTYSKKYEDYVSDQFINRDAWISLKSRCEYALGKIENNNIIYGENDFLFEKTTEVNERRINSNVNAINKFADKVNSKVAVMIAPNSHCIYKEYLPDHSPIINSEKVIGEIYDKIHGAEKINVIESMNLKKNEKLLYYKTDHHWTSEGAYTAYSEYIKTIGKNPVSLQKMQKHSVYDFLGTYYSKAKPYKYEADIIEFYDVSDVEMKIDNKTYNTLYDISKLHEKDKYSVFLYGNNPLTIIKNKNYVNEDKLLVVKDSYANSMIPFLTADFQEIHVIDLRSFQNKVSDYAEEVGFSNILILYNLDNFMRDADIIKL